MGGKTWREPLHRAIERLNAEAGDEEAEPLQGTLYECYLCELLGLTLLDLANLDYQQAEEQAGWVEGGKIGEWARHNPPNGQS